MTVEDARRDNPADLSDVDRANIVAALSTVISTVVLDDTNAIEVSVEHGWDAHAGPDGLSTQLKKNRTMTVLVMVNGGAQGDVYPEKGSLVYRGTD